MVGDFLAHLLHISSCGDSWDQLLQVSLEARNINDVEKDEVLKALRNTQATNVNVS